MVANEYPSNWPLDNSVTAAGIPTPQRRGNHGPPRHYTPAHFLLNPGSHYSPVSDEPCCTRHGNNLDESSSIYSQGSGQCAEQKGAASSYYDDSSFLSTWTDGSSSDVGPIGSSNTTSVNNSASSTSKSTTTGNGNDQCDVGALCDNLINDYMHLIPGSTPNLNTYTAPLSPGKNKPLPPLPQSLSTSTLSSSDFTIPTTEEERNKENGAPSVMVHRPKQKVSVDPIVAVDSDVDVPSLPLPTKWDVGPQAAVKALEAHMQSRMPIVMATSGLLQKNLGLWGHQLQQPQEFGLLLAQSGITGNFQDMTGTPGGERRMKNWGARTELREALLLHGQQPYGRQSKTELSSISFHDITPGEKGAFRNELLAHFGADGRPATRLTLYEVNVPLPTHPQQAPRGERWMHVLISVPFLPRPAPTIHNSIYLHGDSIPTSWVLMAIPQHSITIHPPTQEASPPKPWSINTKTLTRQDFDFGIPTEPIDSPLRHDRNHDQGPQRKLVQFEFMDKLRGIDTIPKWMPDVCNATSSARYERELEFAKLMRVLQEDNPGVNFLCIPPTTSDATEAAESSRPTGLGLGAGLGIRMGRFDQNSTQSQGREQGLGKNSPWYREMEEKLREDGERWRKIYRAMTTGNCRVICRTENADGGIKTVLRNASKRIGRTKLSQEVGR